MAVETSEVDLANARVEDVESILRNTLKIGSEEEGGSNGGESQGEHVSFIVGGGKKTRAKYHDGLPKAVIAVCQSKFNLIEDRSGAPGTYKYSHDTNKDVKVVHVYPKLRDTSTPTNPTASSSSSTNNNNTSSPELRQCYESKIKEFEDTIIKRKVTSFSQRRNLLRILKTRQERVREIEARQIEAYSGNANVKVGDDEVAIVEETNDIAEKIVSLTKVMENMLVGGNDDSNGTASGITEIEKLQVLKELEKKISVLEHDVKADGCGSKKIEKIMKQLELIRKRKTMVSERDTVEPAKLLHEKELREVYAQLLRIEKLENGSGGGSKLQTSLDVLKEIGMKDDILRKQQELESGCFGWFMDEEVVKSRLKVVKSSTKTAFNNGMKRKDKSGSMNGSGSGAGKFTSVSGTKKNYHNVASTNRNYNSNPFDVLG